MRQLTAAEAARVDRCQDDDEIIATILDAFGPDALPTDLDAALARHVEPAGVSRFLASAALDARTIREIVASTVDAIAADGRR